jgi:5'-3' exonuclease
MGIPSYFRGILTKYPGCLIKRVEKVETLAFDFNCLIYRCIRGPSMPVYSLDTHDQWESALLKEVEATVKEIWSYAGKPKRVLLAVDGVVPMAKIRQQRVRRFKSVWLRQTKVGWDTNAITPGTEFMDKLGIMLKRNKSWIVSGVDEEGEGEHKIMDWLRGSASDPLGVRGSASDPLAVRGSASDPIKGKVVVYGLDADLILLSMLTGEKCGLDLFLLREVQEFGKVREASTQQEYQYLNIREFQSRLGLVGYDDTLNYIGYMSLMGNDFLPHSLTHKLSDDGHEFVMDCVKRDLVAGTRLITDGKVCLPRLKSVFEAWAVGQEDRLLHLIRKKREQAVRGVGKGMAEEEGLALKWDVEAAFLEGSNLKGNWQHIYWTFLHKTYNVEHICCEYIKGFQWIIDYYTGQPVNKAWIFPAWLPPLWSDLAAFLESDASVSIEAGMPHPIKPQEQLAMVLPLESWGLIRDPKLRRLPVAAPQMWPKTFGFVSVGRKWLWECEARIPVLTAERVRQICEEN